MNLIGFFLSSAEKNAGEGGENFPVKNFITYIFTEYSHHDKIEQDKIGYVASMAEMIDV